MIIESLQNDKIKYVTRLLTDNRFRRKENVFAVEGIQENERAVRFGFEAKEYFINENLFKGNLPNGKINKISEKLYSKVAYRGTTEGIIGIYNAKENELSSYIPSTNASIIIIEGTEKPGNLGAILRSCEAFGIEALIVTDPKTDFFNPNVIRSSVGCLFGMNIYQSNNQATLDFLQKNEVNIYTTFMDDTAQPLSNRDFKSKSAILFGTEHSGLSDFWLQKGLNTLIPMIGTIDSLNLSNAVAITCYETLRQKQD